MYLNTVSVQEEPKTQGAVAGGREYRVKAGGWGWRDAYVCMVHKKRVQHDETLHASDLSLSLKLMSDFLLHIQTFPSQSLTIILI